MRTCTILLASRLCRIFTFTFSFSCLVGKLLLGNDNQHEYSKNSNVMIYASSLYDTEVVIFLHIHTINIGMKYLTSFKIVNRFNVIS